MPTDRDRAARRRASEALATEYGWPSGRRSRRRWMVAFVVADAASIVLAVFLAAYLLGWRP